MKLKGYEIISEKSSPTSFISSSPSSKYQYILILNPALAYFCIINNISEINLADAELK